MIGVGGEAEARCTRREENWGSGGLPPGKFSVTTPFRSLQNAHILKNLLFVFEGKFRKKDLKSTEK